MPTWRLITLLFTAVLISSSVLAQFQYPEPGLYVDFYTVDVDTNTLAEDTTTWSRRTYTNGFHSLTETRDTTWLGANPISKQVFFGDPSQLDSIHLITIDGINETLVSKNVYEYPATNEMVLRTFNLQNNNLEENDRRYRIFDAAGRMIQETTMLIDWQSNLLDFAYRFNFSYTPFSALDTTWIYGYENGAFEIDQIIYRTFNNANDVVDQFYTAFENGVQTTEQRYEHFYNNSGILDHIHHYFYEPNGTFNLERYYSYEHDLNGMTTYEIEYDVIGPDTLNDWYVGHEVFWDYDGVQLTSSEFKMYFSGGAYNVWNRRYVYSSSIFPISIEEPIEEDEVQLFPNPVIDVLQVTSSRPFTSVVVFDVSGSQVLSLQQPRGNTGSVPTSSLESGHYIMKILLEDGRAIDKKLIKR